MPESYENKDHETEKETGMAVLRNGDMLATRDNTQGVEVVHEPDAPAENVFRRHIKDDPNKIKMAKHRLWLDSLQREYPMPFVPYRVGVYIRFFNQTKYSDEVYLEKHKAQFREDIACCPKWTLVDYYIDSGSVAPGMEYSKEWLRLLDDCFSGKVNLIVTQKISNVSNDPGEMTFVARILANQKPPIGIYFISEDIFTLASYFWADMRDVGFVRSGWKILPPDELDLPVPSVPSKLLEDKPLESAAAGEVM